MANKTKKYPINYDNTPLGNLIIAAENPDSIGWDNNTRRWYAPTLKGYDRNNFGIGIDRKIASPYLQKDKKGKEYLTEEDERNIRNEQIDTAVNGLSRRENFATEETKLENNASENTKNKTISYIYNMGNKNVANSSFDTLKNNDPSSTWYNFMKNYLNDDFDAVQNAINQSYLKQGKNERIKNEN